MIAISISNVTAEELNKETVREILIQIVTDIRDGNSDVFSERFTSEISRYEKDIKAIYEKVSTDTIHVNTSTFNLNDQKATFLASINGLALNPINASIDEKGAIAFEKAEGQVLLTFDYNVQNTTNMKLAVRCLDGKYSNVNSGDTVGLNSCSEAHGCFIVSSTTFTVKPTNANATCGYQTWGVDAYIQDSGYKIRCVSDCN